MTTRREFLKLGALATVGLATPLRWLSKPLSAYAATDAASPSNHLAKFGQAMRKVGLDIPLMVPDAYDAQTSYWSSDVTHYTIDIGQYEDHLHPDLPNRTRLWGYGQGYSPFNPKWTCHLGGLIAVKSGTPVQITFRNFLPPDHILPIDETIMGVMGNQNNRACVHIHGGLVPWISDGGPHAWWDPDGHQGESFLNNQVLRPGQVVPANEAEYYYPNDQSSRVLWYHDHTFGLTRLNAYAGVATGYVIYDDYEISLMGNPVNLPGPLDPRTEYLVFQDKVFVTPEMLDPTPGNLAYDAGWVAAVKNTQAGDLWYSHTYEPDPALPGLPSVSEVPEFFGDNMLVNGTVFPYLDVERRQYRFRLLNACNARFLNLRLVYADPFDEEEVPTILEKGPGFVQISTEGGFLSAPVAIDGETQQLLLAPAERADLIVDFSSIPVDPVHPNEDVHLILYNDALAPYPSGDPVIGPTPGFEGYGPNTQTILQIRVRPTTGTPDPEIHLPSTFTQTDPFLVPMDQYDPIHGAAIPSGVPVRYLTLNEEVDELGRLIQYLGTNFAPNPATPTVLGREYHAAATEVVKVGSTEVWEIINLSMDTHPIHFHLVNVQILSRQGFVMLNTDGTVDYGSNPAVAPDLNEMGWKETVRVNPMEVIRVIMKFDLPSVPFDVPDSKRPELGVEGHEYVWHCHILEHEEHDMMRPLIVQMNKTYFPFTPLS